MGERVVKWEDLKQKNIAKSKMQQTPQRYLENIISLIQLFHTLFSNDVVYISRYQRWIFQKTITVGSSSQTTEQQPFHFFYVYEWCIFFVFITAQAKLLDNGPRVYFGTHSRAYKKI